MATLAQIADELSSSPAVQFSHLPADELGQQLERQSRLDERWSRLGMMVAAKNNVMAEIGLSSGSLASLAQEAIIGSPASIMATTVAEMSNSALATCLAEMNKGYLASIAADTARSAVQGQFEQMNAEYGAALASMRASIPEGLLTGLRVSALLPAVDYKAQLESMGAAFGKPAELAASLTRELSGMYGLADNQQARDFLEWIEQDGRRLRRSLIEPALIDRAIWPGPEQLADIYRQLGQPYDVSEMADILAARQAPAVSTRRPEPPALPPPQSGNFGIQHAQPGQPVDWQQALADALSAGLATRDQVVQWLLQQDSGSQPLPLWADIEVIALDYQRNGSRYENMAAFARKYRLSRATLDRYLRHYEAATGKQIRPGQGRAKRKGMI